MRALKHLRDKSAGRAGGDGATLASERAKLAAEQRETAALRNAVTRGDLISIKSIIRAFTGDLVVLRERLLTIPGKCAGDLEGMTRAEIEARLIEEISDALTALSDPLTYSKRGDSVPLGVAGSVQGPSAAA